MRLQSRKGKGSTLDPSDARVSVSKYEDRDKMRQLYQARDGLWWCSRGCGPFRKYESVKQHTCSKKMLQTIGDVATIDRLDEYIKQKESEAQASQSAGTGTKRELSEV